MFVQVLWTEFLPIGQANGIRNSLEAAPDNPKYAEQCTDSQGRPIPCPERDRTALYVTPDGTQGSIGILDDGWGPSALASLNPSIQLGTLSEPDPPIEDPSDPDFGLLVWSPLP